MNIFTSAHVNSSEVHSICVHIHTLPRGAHVRKVPSVCVPTVANPKGQAACCCPVEMLPLGYTGPRADGVRARSAHAAQSCRKSATRVHCLFCQRLGISKWISYFSVLAFSAIAAELQVRITREGETR